VQRPALSDDTGHLGSVGRPDIPGTLGMLSLTMLLFGSGVGPRVNPAAVRSCTPQMAHLRMPETCLVLTLL
jgi:hypothetical protein